VHSSGAIPIKSVERATSLLSLFSANDTVLSLGEIACRLSMSRATADRYCVSLRETGLLRHDPASNVYMLGPPIIMLGTATLSSLGFLKSPGRTSNDSYR